MSRFPPIEELLLHRGDMLLVDRVVDHRPGAIRVIAKVDATAWYADAEGRMPAWIAIELMAQAVAALAGLSAHARGERPAPGFLLGTRSLRCICPHFVAGQEALVSAREIFKESNGLAAFDCDIAVEGKRLAEATLKVYEPAEPNAFLTQ